MSFKIQHGLFQFDFTDLHAILGVPLDAEADVIRKQYLKIARNLHPDRCKDKSEPEKQLANQLLSKLVNPAYEKLYPDKNLVESKIMLGRLGKRLAVEGGKAQLFTEPAKQLSKAGSNLDAAYKSQVQSLAASQYENFSQSVDIIAQISELNLVYLMRKQGELGSKGSKPTVETPVEQKDQKPVEDKTPVADPLQDSVESYCRRAEEYIAKNNFAKATLELRDALKSSPNSSRCHGLLGTAYLYQKQLTMAKVHINKALELNPKEESAQKAKEFLDKLAQKEKGATATPSTGKNPQSKPDEKSGGTTIFGIKFGGKKK